MHVRYSCFKDLSVYLSFINWTKNQYILSALTLIDWDIISIICHRGKWIKCKKSFKLFICCKILLLCIVYIQQWKQDLQEENTDDIATAGGGLFVVLLHYDGRTLILNTVKASVTWQSFFNYLTLRTFEDYFGCCLMLI